MADPDVDRFLNTFQELSSTRFLENDNRISTLEKEVERKRQAYKNSPKKKGKPMVPTKSVSLQSINIAGASLDHQKPNSNSFASRSIYRDLDIELLNPIARPSDFDLKPYASSLAQTGSTSTEVTYKERHDSLAELMNQLDVNSSFKLSERKANEPKPIKADDYLNTPTRTDLIFSPKTSIFVSKRATKKEDEQPTTIKNLNHSTVSLIKSSPNEYEDDSSTDDGEPEQLEPWKFGELEKSYSSNRLSLLNEHGASDRSSSTVYKSSVTSHKSIDLNSSNFSDRALFDSSNKSASSKFHSDQSSVSSRQYSDKHKVASELDRSISNNSSTSHISAYKKPKPTPIPKAKPKTPRKPIANVALDYIPMPNSMAVMSAVAAAKAPALSPNKIDTTVGERAPDLFMHAKFLTSGGASSPTKRSDELVSDSLNKKGPMFAAVANSKLSYNTNKPNVPLPKKKRINEIEDERKVSVITLTRKLKPTPTPAPKPKAIHNLVPEKFTSNLKPSKYTKTIESEEKPDALKRVSALNKPKITPKPEEKVPEGILRFSTLNKPKPSPKLEREVPEALKRVGRLNKPKVAPKPQIELPEALQKFERFRTKINNKLESKISATHGHGQLDSFSTSPTRNSPNRSHTFPTAQSGPHALPGLANNQMFQKLASTLNNTIKNSFNSGISPSISSSPSPYDTLDDPPVRTISKATTVDNSELEKEGQKLKHITKGRAKGPKRRLPKKVASTEDESQNSSLNITKVRSTTPKKTPPVIRKSSRKVSGGDIFL